MTIYKTLVGLTMTIGICLVNENHASRTKRSTPLVTEIYALDHFIEIIEKIEAQESEFSKVADYIRSLAYKDDYWSKVIGPNKTLPGGILTSTQSSVLSKMVVHKYVGAREQGVVRTSGGETIAMGAVIAGIMAGINRNKKFTLNDWASGATREIDNLYVATLSTILAETSLAKAQTPANELFGPGGSWDSKECPSVYTKASSIISMASDAQLLGAMDGFILGREIQSWARKTRLGQLLRMYYDTEICFDKSFASCKRLKKFKELTNVDTLFGQVEGVADGLHIKNPSSYSKVDKEFILSLSKDVATKFFTKIESISTVQQCVTSQPGCELPANLVFLMDESGSISAAHFIIEKDFVRKILDSFNVSPRLTKVGLIEFGESSAIDFDLDVYGSKTRMKCAINKTVQQRGRTNTAGAIDLAREKIFLPLQNEQEKKSNLVQSSRNNILILLTDGKSNMPNTSEIFASVKRIKKQIKDLTMIAIGIGDYNLMELESFATDKKKHVITAKNFNELLTLVKVLQNETCKTPIRLSNFEFKTKGNATEIKAFVSPGQRQLLTLPSSQFFGSSIFLDITPQHGNLKLYTSRTSDTPGPDNYDYKLDSIPDGQTKKIAVLDACKGAPDVSSCKPLYIGIYHGTDTCSCREQSCYLPGQIAFTMAKGDPPPPSANGHRFTSSVSFLFIATLVVIVKNYSS